MGFSGENGKGVVDILVGEEKNGTDSGFAENEWLVVLGCSSLDD